MVSVLISTSFLQSIINIVYVTYYFAYYFILSAFPGPPSAPKIVSAFKDCISLAWSAPANTGGTNILGYNVEKCKNGSNLWSLVNPTDEPIRGKIIHFMFDLVHLSVVM